MFIKPQELLQQHLDGIIECQKNTPNIDEKEIMEPIRLMYISSIRMIENIANDKITKQLASIVRGKASSKELLFSVIESKEIENHNLKIESKNRHKELREARVIISRQKQKLESMSKTLEKQKARYGNKR